MGSESLICLNLTTVSFPGESPLPIQVRGSNKSARAVILDGSCSSQKHTSVYSCNEGAGASIFQVNNVNISRVTRTDLPTDTGTSRPTETHATTCNSDARGSLGNISRHNSRHKSRQAFHFKLSLKSNQNPMSKQTQNPYTSRSSRSMNNKAESRLTRTVKRSKDPIWKANVCKIP